MTEKTKFFNLERFGFGPNVMKKTKVCSECGQITKANAKKCPHCGTKLSAETLYDKYKEKHICCPFCDRVLRSNSNYCQYCGKQITPAAAGTKKAVVDI